MGGWLIKSSACAGPEHRNWTGFYFLTFLYKWETLRELW